MRGEAWPCPPTASEGLPARLSGLAVCRIAAYSGDAFLRVWGPAEGVSHVRHVIYWRSLGLRQLAADTF